MKKNKKTRLQRKEEKIIQRDVVIKALIDLIAKNKIGIPMQLFNVIKDIFKIDIQLDPEKMKKQEQVKSNDEVEVENVEKDEKTSSE